MIFNVMVIIEIIIIFVVLMIIFDELKKIRKKIMRAESNPWRRNTMPNMSYCRMENTYNDLRDADAHINEELSESEEKYKKKLIKLCKRIVNDCEYDDED